MCDKVRHFRCMAAVLNAYGVPFEGLSVAESDGDREADDKGLSCPECGCKHLPVWYTRPRLNKIMRVRKCRNCGMRLTTYERIG